MLNLKEAMSKVENEFFAGYTITVEQKLKNEIQFTAERSGFRRMYWLVKDYYKTSWEVQTCEYENSKTVFIIL